MLEFLHVGSYLVKEHRSEFFFAEFCFVFKKKTGRKTRSAAFVFFCAKQKQKKTIRFFCFVKINEAVQSRVDMNNKGIYS